VAKRSRPSFEEYQRTKVSGNYDEIEVNRVSSLVGDLFLGPPRHSSLREGWVGVLFDDDEYVADHPSMKVVLSTDPRAILYCDAKCQERAERLANALDREGLGPFSLVDHPRAS
jgi:hypothetical protein